MTEHHGHTLSKDCWCNPTVLNDDIDWEAERRKIRPVVFLPEADPWKIPTFTKAEVIREWVGFALVAVAFVAIALLINSGS